jgi:acyl-coenzyme A synthetase/AMP-(fatty) acid ligase
MSGTQPSIAECTPCALPPQRSLISSQTRSRLKLDPRIGAGNFLRYAHRISPSPALPIVHSDVPFEALGLTRRDLSMSELEAAADSYAAWYWTHGIRPLEPVAVYCADGMQCLLQYVALTAIGAIPAITNGELAGELAAQYFRRVGVVAIVTDRARRAALLDHCRVGDFKFLELLDDIAGADRSALPAWFPYSHDADSPVMITHSSGTTGAPKAVILQHGRWFHGIRYLLGLEPPEGADRYLSALPASHNAAIAYAIHALLSGAEMMLMSSRRGTAVAQAVERFRPATVIAFPQTYLELAELDPESLNLESVTTWINSGDAAHETHIRRLVTRGHHHRGGERVSGSQFVDGLGSSELGHSSFRVIHTLFTNTYERCVGVPQHWVEAAVLDEHGSHVPAGVVGRLGVKSPSVTEGYWNDSLLTYRSRVRGYWLTGDLVFRDDFGYYYHVDRVSDVVGTVEGPLYTVQTEELILKEHQSLADCTVIGIGSGQFQRAMLLVIPRTGHTVDSAAMLQSVNAVQAQRLRPSLHRIEVVAASDIPLGVTGKVVKRLLRERFAS